MLNSEIFTIVIGVLFALSESLSLIPQVKANGVLQLIFDIIKKLAGK